MKTREILFIIFAVIAFAINVLIIVLSATNGEMSSNQSLGFTKMIVDMITAIFPNSSIVQDQGHLHHIVRKLFGHFLLFGGSGLFTTLMLMFSGDIFKNRKMETIVFSLTIGLTIASVSECIQLITPDRAFAFTDILIDFSGYLLFTILIFFILYLINKVKSHRSR